MREADILRAPTDKHKHQYYSIGTMSGTSMDGIDVALLYTDGEAHTLALGHVSVPYTPDVKCLLKGLEGAVRNAKGSMQQAALLYPQALRDYLVQSLGMDLSKVEAEISRLTMVLQKESLVQTPLSAESVVRLSTLLHAQAIQLLLRKTKKNPRDIDFIGYHGQTLFHSPQIGITVQMGDGPWLAELTGITVINQFRNQDIAAGGQGAPFAPIYHFALANQYQKIPLAFVNCGGIANVTLIPSADFNDTLAYDTGPGNGLIDALIKKRTGAKELMDKNGRYGLCGTVNPQVLKALYEKALVLENTNYFLKKPPKSLDINDMHFIPELDALSLQDACATLAAFTADTIVSSLDLLELSQTQMPRHWILAGGGWKNPVIQREFKDRLKAKWGGDVVVQTAEEVTWNGDAIEAQTFAYCAVRSAKKLSLSAPGTTRVPHPMTGGHAHMPPAGPTPAVAALMEFE